MEKNELIGTWRLVSFEIKSADGQITYPFGQAPVGYILYSEDGYFCVAIMRANRPPFAGGDMLAGSREEKAAAAETYLSYCGTYEIRGDTAVHHVEVTLFPNWVGAEQERMLEKNGDQLLMSTPPLLMDSKPQVLHITWERA
jgi:hypothetical protein